jgi:predicted nucleotidyltransferase
MTRKSFSGHEDARQRATLAAEILARDPRVRLVYWFGSSAEPDCPSPRDLDLAVLSEPAIPFEELLRIRADLVEHTGAPIDLVSLDEAGIVLAHEVAETGRCLYAATPDVETEFVVRARARWLDFAPYREEQWELAGRRLEERRGGS